MGKRWISIRALEDPVEVVNTKTGEVLFRGIPVIQRQIARDRDFVKVFYSELLRQDLGLSKSEQKVFLALLEAMNSQNIVVVPGLKGMAEKFNLKYGTIKNIFSKLQRLSLIRKIAQNIYRINPAIAAKTDGEGRIAILKVWEQAEEESLPLFEKPIQIEEGQHERVESAIN